MKILYDTQHGVWHVSCTHSEYKAGRIPIGFSWNGHIARWETDDREAVRPVLHLATVEAAKQLAVSAKVKEPSAQALLTVADGDIIPAADEAIRLHWDAKRRHYYLAGVDEHSPWPLGAGFTHSPASGWYTGEPYIANSFLSYADTETAGLLRTASDKRDRLTALCDARGWSGDSPISIPWPEDAVPTFPYQEVGTYYMLENGSALNGDDTGLGKTRQTYGLINVLTQSHDLSLALAVVPAAVKLNWADELRLWAADPWWHPRVVTGSYFPRKSALCEQRGMARNLVIINYDLLNKYYKQIRDIPWQLIIADEAHRVKNRNTKRGQLFYSIQPVELGGVKRKIALTADPMHNNPEELWALLNYLQPEEWGGITAFKTRYCAAVKSQRGAKSTGSSNEAELHKRLGGTMIRRKKRDVLDQLPEKSHRIILFEKSADIETLERRLKEESPEQYQEFQRRFDSAVEMDHREGGDIMGPMSVIAQDAPEEVKKRLQLDLSLVERLRHDISLAKVSQGAEVLLDYLDGSDDKVLFLTWFKDSLANVKAIVDKEKRHRTAIITGDITSLPARQAIQDDFNTEGSDLRVLFATMGTMAEGVNLQAGRVVMFLDSYWKPYTMRQAIGRIDRLGQKHSHIEVIQMAMEGTLDEYVAAKVLSKERMIVQIVDGEAA